MSKGAKIALIVLGSIVGFFVFIALLIAGSYNGMVGREQAVQEAWSQVETQYQRRTDLVPQLVEVVRGIADQEEDVLTAVTEARASASQIKVDDQSDAKQLKRYAAAQGDFESALSRLLVTVEAYPQIASQQNFANLQAQIEGTENRISVARQRYNTEVTSYNTAIKSFPRNILAGIFGFDEYERFEADEGAENAPNIDLTDEEPTPGG